MRKEFIQCKTRTQAKKQAPWACTLAKVMGGYMAFESHYDYEVWRNQK